MSLEHRALDSHDRRNTDAWRVNLDDAHVLGARRDSTLSRGVVEMVHRVQRALEATEDQQKHEGSDSCSVLTAHGDTESTEDHHEGQHAGRGGAGVFRRHL